MVDAIGSSSTDWSRAIDSDDDEVRRRAEAASTTKVATAPPEVPQGPDTNGALLVRAAQGGQATQAAATPRLLLALGVDAAAVRLPDQDTAVQKRMDSFFNRAVPTYRLPAGPGKAIEVAVATPFRMVGPTRAPRNPDDATLRAVVTEVSVRQSATELSTIAGKVGIGAASLSAIKVGRGTPSQVQALTQALIDANKLPPARKDESDVVRVRRMMCDYGIGFDCAGYTQQALLAAHGITRAQAGLDLGIVNESLSNLSTAHFARVAPEDARAGDVLALGPPDPRNVGHRVIVFDRHDASPEELRRYCSSGQGGSLDKGHVTVLSVDSSYGSSAHPANGGVQRQTWLYDGKQWGTVFPAHLDSEQNHIPERVQVTKLPYDGSHPLIGIYHYKGEH
jgi:hypothetical protein